MEPGAGSVALRQAGQTLPLNRKCLEHIGSRHCLVASPARFERATFRLGVALICCSSVAVKRGKSLILLDFTVVTLLVMYGFFLLIFIVFCGRN